jgi:hypothetical protein
MKTFKTNIKVIVSFIFLLSALLVLIGCARAELFVPEYTGFTPPPDEITTEQLLSDYRADEVAADDKYKGKRFLFTDIVVEGLTVFIVDPATDPNIYIVNNSVEFRPKFNVDTALVREDFVVDILGSVRGLFGTDNSFVIVEDCWIGVTEGDVGGDIPDWGY